MDTILCSVQEITQMNSMHYFSSKVTGVGSKRKLGAPKNFPALQPEYGPHFQFASYAPAFEGLIGLRADFYGRRVYSCCIA